MRSPGSPPSPSHPVIQHQRDGEWVELYGHACSTTKEAEKYIKAIGKLMPGGLRLKPKEE